jgi:hypothetical protein
MLQRATIGVPDGHCSYGDMIGSDREENGMKMVMG